jgi:NAD(P)-dependent dehydrogenase (short-subunit alcohol dehydrogenase family)
MVPLAEAGATVHRLDVADEVNAREVVERIHVEDGPLDALVNNAGLAVLGPVEEVPLDEARRQFEVNLFGTARLVRMAVPRMRERGSGRIVNISSMGGRAYTPLGAWYHASKHALEGWSDCLRLELADFGLQVVIVEPGAIATEFAEIAVVPMLERSGEGPYGDLVGKMAAATRRTFASGKASPPNLIGKVVVTAIESPRPKTRYVAGHLARPVLLARRLLGDRGYDWAVRTFL